ncbi:MAG: HEAT repeat domain-containing protein, partial [Planctomycetota bacterium]|nr:HEAT repeat domain-containing protein [Planctomycetota bacterium]
MRSPLIVRLAFCILAPCLAAEDGTAPPVAIPDPKPLQQIFGKDVRGWIEHLKKYENEKERKLAMFCLIDFGPAAADAVPELVTLCKDELQPDTQRWAMDALGAIGATAKDAVPDLLAVLNDVRRPATHRAAACEALGQIDPEAQPVRKAVLGAFRDQQPEVRAAAIDAAISLTPYDPAALPALAKALNNPPDAPAAATALRCIGAPA